MNEVLRPEPDAVPVTAPGNAPQMQPLPRDPLTERRRSISPLNRRRFANFRANRRGYWSALVFALLFVVSLFAELIANDRDRHAV
jgi:microcin C transport system permease protein